MEYFCDLGIHDLLHDTGVLKKNCNDENEELIILLRVVLCLGNQKEDVILICSTFLENSLNFDRITLKLRRLNGQQTDSLALVGVFRMMKNEERHSSMTSKDLKTRFPLCNLVLGISLQPPTPSE